MLAGVTGARVVVTEGRVVQRPTQSGKDLGDDDL